MNEAWHHLEGVLAARGAGCNALAHDADRPRREPSARGQPLGPYRPLPTRGGGSVVVQLYDHLLALTGSPVVVLNRAVALAEIDGPEAALAAIEPLNSDTRMIGYQPFWAAKGHLLARTGTHVDAAEAYRVAISSVVRVGVDAKRDGVGCEIGEHRVLAAAGTLAAWIPARRTARIDPIQALRYE
jgi:hypothetical protein